MIFDLSESPNYTKNNKTRPNLDVLFNDLEDSQIESRVSKIDRVRRFSQNYSLPKNVTIDFSQKDYDEILPQLIKRVNQQQRSKALFFIDPYGYKDIKPSELKEVLANGDTEILLFLPIAHMYRFVIPALQKNTSGSEPLRDFLLELFGSNITNFQSALNDN